MIADWTVTHDPNGTPTVLDDVQQITSFYGKHKISDPRRPSRITVTGRNVTALPTINLYDAIEIEARDGSDNYLVYLESGVVVDFEIIYGIVPAQDIWVLTVNSNENSVASTVFSGGSLTSGDTLEDAITDFITNIPGITGGAYTTLPDLRVSGVTLTGLNVSEVLDKFAATGALQWAIDTSGTQLSFGGPYLYGTGIPTRANLTDDGTGTDPIKYDRLTFSSLADNYAPVIEIDSDTGSTVTVGIGRRTEVFNTYSFNSSEATSLAQYYELLYSSDEPTPAEVSFLWSSIPAGRQQKLDYLIADIVDVTFRTNTYETLLIGFAVTATPDDTRETLYLAPANITNYLILDDTTFGQLDNNRLGL
jgi:hypothetical protein